MARKRMRLFGPFFTLKSIVATFFIFFVFPIGIGIIIIALPLLAVVALIAYATDCAKQDYETQLSYYGSEEALQKAQLKDSIKGIAKFIGYAILVIAGFSLLGVILNNFEPVYIVPLTALFALFKAISLWRGDNAENKVFIKPCIFIAFVLFLGHICYILTKYYLLFNC